MTLLTYPLFPTEPSYLSECSTCEMCLWVWWDEVFRGSVGSLSLSTGPTHAEQGTAYYMFNCRCPNKQHIWPAWQIRCLLNMLFYLCCQDDGINHFSDTIWAASHFFPSLHCHMQADMQTNTFNLNLPCFPTLLLYAYLRNPEILLFADPQMNKHGFTDPIN